MSPENQALLDTPISVPITMTTQQLTDIWEAASERGVSVEQLMLQATLNDLFR